MLAARGQAALAVVETTDGRKLAGELTLAGGQFTFVPTNGTALPLAFDDIAHGTFNLTNLPSGTPAVPQDGTLPAPWRGQEIGATAPAGVATHRDGTFTLQGAGDALWSSRPDSFHFVHQTLVGDGQITARIASSGARHAGVMMRDSTAPDALFAAMLWENGDLLSFRSRRGARYRTQFNHEGDWQNRHQMHLPRWVRLQRNGREFRGYLSWDNGARWEQFHRGTVEMGSNILVGLFVMSGENGRTAEARFDNVTVAETSEEESPSRRHQRSAVVLRNGTVITGEILSADDSRIRLQRAGRPVTISTPQVARLLFRRFAPPAGGDRIPARPGVLLDRGDFLDAEFGGLEKGEVKVSSVLFGVRRYRAGSQAAAVVLRDIVPDPRHCHVTTVDGCVWVGSSARVQQEQLVMNVPVIGATTVPWSDVVEVRRPAAARN